MKRCYTIGHDDRACRRHLELVSVFPDRMQIPANCRPKAKSNEADQDWRRIRKQFSPLHQPSHSVSIESLNMLKLGSYNHGAETWDWQTYADFADRVQRRNPSVGFTKEIMDEAFGLAIRKISNSVKARRRFDKMVHRVCVRCEERRVLVG